MWGGGAGAGLCACACVVEGGGVYHRSHIVAVDYDGLFPGLCEFRGLEGYGGLERCDISAEAADARDVG